MPLNRAVFLSSPAFRRNRGFALLVTITLLAFLVLLLVGLSSMTRVETQVTDNGQKLTQARSNALFALNVALGELQRFTGPDQRVTATADIGDGTNNALPVPSDGTRHWTGVWGNGNSSTATSSSPVFLDWLVSGNSNTTVKANADGSISSAAATPAFTSDAKVNGLADGSTALSTGITVGGTSARLLVGPGSVGNASIGLGTTGYVVAPVVPMQVAASSIPGLRGTTLVTIGNYAWWVGDEGVKARGDLVESEASIASTDTDTQRLRYRAPARDGVELMGNTTAALSSADMEASATASLRADLRKIVASAQFAFSGGGSPFTTAFLQQHFYDLTGVSTGVLSNTLAGGLRQDLTAAFAPGTTSATSPAGPIWQVTPASGSVTDYDKGPDWQLLRSYYQLPFSSNASGSGTSMSFAAQPQIDGTTNSQPSAAQQGVFPVVAFWQLFVEAKVMAEATTGQVQLRYYPALVLWNPYNVTLKDQTYHLTYSLAGGDVTFVRIFKTPTTAVYYVPAGSGIVGIQAGTPWVDSNNLPVVKVAVSSGDMAPGAAYVYTLPGDGAYNNTDFSAYNTLTRGWHNGGNSAIQVTSPLVTFAAPLTGGATAADFSASFWRGTQNAGGLSVVPPWNVATTSTASNGVSGGGNTWNSSLGTVPSSAPGSGQTEPATRDDTLVLADASGNVLQTIANNNNYNHSFKLRWEQTAFLNVPLASGGAARGTFSIGYTGSRWALKASALPSTTTFPAASSLSPENYPVRWLADYNPRAPYSARSPYEMQNGGTNSSGYFWTNPSYDSALNVSSTTYGTVPFDATNASIPYYSSVTDPSDPDYGAAYVGVGLNSIGVPPKAVLFNLPRSLSLNGTALNESVVSLGEFQHAQLYRVNGVAFASNSSPAYAFGNSFAQPRASLSAPYLPWSSITSTSYAGANVYDDSYLLNRAIWDGYFLSTVPRNEAATGADSFSALPNPRMIFYPRSGATLPGDLLDAQKSAATLLVNGAFNVNSTSVDAWTALIGGLCNVPVGSNKITGDSPYPRASYPGNATYDANVLDTTSTTDAASDANAYQGYRSLTTAQIKALATQIVLQVRRRGPFVSLADFVNRAFSASTLSSTTTYDNRLMGALAQAISDAGLNSAFSTTTATEQAQLPAAGYTKMVENAAAGVAATAVPGWLTQADLLQPLGPSLSARSDTFVIRTYGDAQNPVTGAVTGRAWCEAVVQRLPEYSSPANNPWDALSALNSQNQLFGRRYKIVSFRWLSPGDI